MQGRREQGGDRAAFWPGQGVGHVAGDEHEVPVPLWIYKISKIMSYCVCVRLRVRACMRASVCAANSTQVGFCVRTHKSVCMELCARACKCAHVCTWFPHSCVVRGYLPTGRWMCGALVRCLSAPLQGDVKDLIKGFTSLIFPH